MIFLRVAFNTLYAAEGARLDDFEPRNFLAVLRESVSWQIDGRPRDKEIDNVVDGIINNLKPA